MVFPFSAPLYHPIAPDGLLAIDERKMSLAVSTFAELRFLGLLGRPHPASCIDCSLRAARRPSESFRDKVPGVTCCGAGWICGSLKLSMSEESFLVSQAPE